MAKVEVGGQRGFPRRTRVRNPYSADIAMPTGEVSPAETRQDPQGYRRSGYTSVRREKSISPLGRLPGNAEN